MGMSPHFTDRLERSVDIWLPMASTCVPGGPNRSIAYFSPDGTYPDWPVFVTPCHEASAGLQMAY